MKKLLLALIIFPFISNAQSDTIFKKDGKVIPCTITLDNGLYLFFTDKKGNSKDIDKKEVVNFKKGNELKNVTEIIPTTNNSEITMLNSDSVTVTSELNYFKTCMADYHRQHTIGSVILFTGLGGGIVSAVTDTDSKSKTTFIAVSSAVTLLGSIIMIDASKHFKRASLGVNGNGVTVKYIFK